MRIAVLSPFVDKQHGTERVLAELIERLALRSETEIHLYSQRVEDLHVTRAVNSTRIPSPAGRIIWHKVWKVPGPHLLQFVWWYFVNRVIRWRDKTLKNYSADLVYSPGINAADVNAITAHIVFHAFYEQVRPELRLSAISPIHWPRTIHRLLYYRLLMVLERRIYTKREIALSAVSQVVANQLKRFFGRNDVVVIRNAVDTRQFNPHARLSRRANARSFLKAVPGDFVFLLIGNDWKKKGLNALLEALTECTDIPLRLFVVGSDNLEPYIEKCEHLRLSSRVHFLNRSSDVLQFYAAADAYVGPSLEDAYGLPVLEAMACGLPVIASVAAGVSEIISDGENGLLLHDPRDVKTLAQLMRKLYTSVDLVARLGDAAVRTAAQESWDVHAARTYDHFLEVLSRRFRIPPN